MAELCRRYEADYRVLGCTVGSLETELARAEAEHVEVAVVLASGEQGAELLGGVRARFPAARRGLLIPWLGWADPEVAALVLRSMARGAIDLYVLRPSQSPDEIFHRTITELLQESARLRGEGPAGAAVHANPAPGVRTSCARSSRASASPTACSTVPAPPPSRWRTAPSSRTLRPRTSPARSASPRSSRPGRPT